MSTDTEAVEVSSEVGDAVIGAAARIETAIMQAGIAYRQMVDGLATAQRTAYRNAGSQGITDLQARVGLDRLNAEIGGALIAAGMRDVLVARPAYQTVTDLALRWQRRVEQGHLTTSRRWKP